MKRYVLSILFVAAFVGVTLIADDAVAVPRPDPAPVGTTLIGFGETAPPARFYGWLAASKMPTPRGYVSFRYAKCDGWVPGLRGCADDTGVWITPQRYVLPFVRGRAEERWAFMHELGHVADFRHVSAVERRALLRALRMDGEWWPDTKNRIEVPGERYADAYADCAVYGRTPAPIPREETAICRTIRRVLR